MKATEIKRALRVKGSKVYGSVQISEDDSTYIELRKSDVQDLVKSMQSAGASFGKWDIYEGNIFIN